MRSLHFPAPLEWIRVDDVIREARDSGAQVSSKAFRNRWADKDSYLVDLATYAITHTKSGDRSAPATIGLRGDLVDTHLTFTARIEALTSSVMAELLEDSRSFLLGHLAAVIHHAPGLSVPLRADVEIDNGGWGEFYDAAIRSVGLR